MFQPRTEHPPDVKSLLFHSCVVVSQVDFMQYKFQGSVGVCDGTVSLDAVGGVWERGNVGREVNAAQRTVVVETGKHGRKVTVAFTAFQ